MFLTITTTRQPATDLGFLLHKHPERAQSFEVSNGVAHVFYPEADDDRCTAALLVELDPIAHVRGRKAGDGIAQYVNDRPYAAGSQFAVALRAVFATALSGRCDARPELAETAIPLRISLPCLAAPGGEDLVRRLFQPLGWQVETEPIALDDWGDSRYVNVTLQGDQRLADALKQLYVLIPVLDGGKHYWVAEEEVGKLLRAGAGWLAGHPERELITQRYLAFSRPLVGSALARLAEADDVAAEALDDAVAEPRVRNAPDQRVPLAVQRQGAVLAALRAAGAGRVLDLGCGSGALLRRMLREPAFTEIVGVDVSARSLDLAERRLELDRLPDSVRARIKLRQSALTYADPALTGFDAAVLMEVIEHVDESRLPALEYAVFAAARPGTVVVTTPNAEYNTRFDGLAPGSFRHADHRFEWTREQFRQWCDEVAVRRGYTVSRHPVGAEDPTLGAPSQLAVFCAREVVA